MQEENLPDSSLKGFKGHIADFRLAMWGCVSDHKKQTFDLKCGSLTWVMSSGLTGGGLTGLGG